MTESERDHVYVYGVVGDADRSIDERGIDDGELYAIESDGLAAIASPIDTTEPERSEERVRQHDEVLRSALENGGGAIVPMQFGMAFESEAAVRNVLEGGREAFERTLDEIGDAVELGVKVVITEPMGQVPTPDEIDEQLAELLDPIAVDHVENDRFSDRLLANRSYLVAESDREAFNEAVADLEEAIDDDLVVQYTGPWPPYSFVDIRVGAK